MKCNRLWRRLGSERGSAYLEYALVQLLVVFVALAAFTPGSVINEAVGSDFTFREVIMKLPIL